MRICTHLATGGDNERPASESMTRGPSATAGSQALKVRQRPFPGMPFPKRTHAVRAVVALVAMWTLSTSAFTIGTSPAQAQPTALEAPLPLNAQTPPQSTLHDVACPGVGTCTAVGQYGNTKQSSEALLEGFKNGTWSPRKAPLPTKHVRNSVLFQVDCPVPSTCSAVGAYNIKYRGQTGLIDSFSNGKWRGIAAPLPSNAHGFENAGQLDAIACSSSSFCVAAGTYQATRIDDYQGLIDTWVGGRQWTSTEAPLPSDASSAPTASGISVACGGPGSCVALFSYGISPTSGGATIDTLSNGVWASTEAPLPSDANTVPDPHLNGVTCSSPTACIAVGGYTNTGGTETGLIETLSDGVWTPTETPETGTYTAISCPSPTSCFATAASQLGSLVEMLANGTWSPVAAPLPNGATGGILLNVACQSVAICVASGYYSDQTNPELGLIEILSSGAWSATAAPMPPNADSRSFMNGTTCPSSGSCVAVGQYFDANSGNTLGLIETIPNDP